MIAVRIATLVAAAVTVIALSNAARFTLRSPLDAAPIAAPAVGPAEPALVARPSSPDSALDVAARRDPFRLTRTAAPERYGATTPPDGYAAPRPPRPPLVLVGIVGGPEPAALVDGIPGADGTRALREGQRVGDLVVRSIVDGRVVITAPDTTWILVVRTAFP